jgi:hypothetical protein
MFKFGIEHEVALFKGRSFADFSNTTFGEFQAVVNDLPVHEADYAGLRVGDHRIKHKRWYVEGYERFNLDGSFRECIPKGIEIRLAPCFSIAQILNGLRESFRLLKQAAVKRGFFPVCASLNPVLKQFLLSPPLNDFEIRMGTELPEIMTADIAMTTYGPDFNFSLEGATDAQIIDIGRKLTFYSPFIVPFSFSSPYCEGKLWDGFSYRTYLRTGHRPAAMVFIRDETNLLKTSPSLTNLHRIPAEAGRIEFKAFDAGNDLNLYAAQFALLKGIGLDRTLEGRSTVPDSQMHKLSAREGFHNAHIFAEARRVLQAAENALGADADALYLAPLKEMLERRTVPADFLISELKCGKSIAEILLCRGTLDWVGKPEPSGESRCSEKPQMGEISPVMGFGAPWRKQRTDLR